jgi:NADH:ubiquinone oxidoreductase subunit
LTDFETPLCLFVSQQMWCRFGCNRLNTQIFSQNLVECLWNANLIGYFLHCQTSVWTDDCTNSFGMLVVFWCGRSSRTWVIFIYLNHLYNHEFEFGSWIHYQTLVLTLQMPLKKFPLNWNLTHTHTRKHMLLMKIILFFLTTEKLPYTPNTCLR